jgi:hypothetical protein
VLSFFSLKKKFKKRKQQYKMLRRVAPSVGMRAAACPQLAAATLRSSVMTKYVHMSEPIGNGKVIPLKFDFIRPAYLCPTLAQYYVVASAWIHFFMWPRLIPAFLIVFACQGGFSGQIPPDPRVINN